VIALLPAAACKHAPANQSRPVAKDEHSQQPAPSAPVAAPAPVPVLSQGPRFAVQVAAFDRRASAEALASRLSDQFGVQTLVAPVEAQGQTLYRVRLLVETKDQAENVADTFLRSEKLKVWIVALP
jgi:cell division septation protein DedD